MPFAEFMDIALYGEGGFYTSGGRAGRRGDFITSPEVGPLFGTVLVRAIDDVWRRLGEPAGFQVVEVGAGPGTLARSIVAARPRCLEQGEYIAVETSAAQLASHPNTVTSTGSMPARIDHGVIVANELWDNMPFELWVHDQGWRSAHVIEQGDGFAEILMPAAVPGVLPSRAPHGARAPVQARAAAWLDETLSRLGAGSLIGFDYCTGLTAELASMPWRQWLRTYAGHGRGTHYLRDVGAQDITVQVCIDQLARVREPDAVRTQSQFLQRWGIEELVEEGRRHWEVHAQAPNLEAIRMRSRISEAEALLDESGLGAFTVLEWTTGRRN